MKLLSRIFMLCGVILLIGTAGASDINNISLFQTVVQAATGLILIFDGIIINNILKGVKTKWKSINYHN